MFNPVNPDGVAPPARKYVHAMTVPAGFRLLSLSGQVGTLPDGSIPDGIEAQTEAAFENCRKCLQAHGMDVENVYKIVQYLTDPRYRDPFFEIRNRFLKDHTPTSTLLFVSALAQPEMLVEVELFVAGPEA
ncbi:MAG: RidA family protein [Alphaproteobacteria bacterium]